MVNSTKKSRGGDVCKKSYKVVFRVSDFIYRKSIIKLFADIVGLDQSAQDI